MPSFDNVEDALKHVEAVVIELQKTVRLQQELILTLLLAINAGDEPLRGHMVRGLENARDQSDNPAAKMILEIIEEQKDGKLAQSLRKLAPHLSVVPPAEPE
jgi:hypothetical protein